MAEISEYKEQSLKQTNLVDALDTILQERHSCRGFLPERVSRQTINNIIESAQRVASWCNSQAWQLYVTEGEGTRRFREALEAHASKVMAGEVSMGDAGVPDIAFPERYEGVYLDRRRECAWQLYESVGVPRGDRAASRIQTFRNFALFDAPHVAIVTTPRALGTYGAVDCGGFIATFTLVAQAYGVSSIAQAALANFSPLVRKFFDVDADRDILCGISFGFEDSTHPANAFRTVRARVEDVVQFVDQ